MKTLHRLFASTVIVFLSCVSIACVSSIVPVSRAEQVNGTYTRQVVTLRHGEMAHIETSARTQIGILGYGYDFLPDMSISCSGCGDWQILTGKPIYIHKGSYEIFLRKGSVRGGVPVRIVIRTPFKDPDRPFLAFIRVVHGTGGPASTSVPSASHKKFPASPL